MKVRAVMGEAFFGKRLHDDRARLLIDRLRLRRIGAEIGKLDRRNPLAHAKLEPPAAHLVEHADFFIRAQRTLQRQNIDERAEPQPLGALRDGGQKHRRRRRHAEWRRVMFREMICVKSPPIIGLDQAQPALVLFGQRPRALIHMVEDSVSHLALPHLLAKLDSKRCIPRTSRPAVLTPAWLPSGIRIHEVVGLFRCYAASGTVGSCAVEPPVRSEYCSIGAGRPNKCPCTSSHASRARKANCSSVSTPSATTGSFRP